MVFAYCVLLILVVAGFLFLVSGVVELYTARASLYWSSCEGTITHSEVDIDSFTIGTGEGHGRTTILTCGVSIRYDYAVDGEQYTGDRYSFACRNFQTLRPAEKIVAEHPIGSTVTVYYSPNAPEQSVLVPGPNTKVYLNIVVSVIAILFLLGVAFLLWYKS